MRTTRLAIAIALASGAGCYGYDDYVQDRAEQSCLTWDRCDLLDVLRYDSVDDCVAQQVAAMEPDCPGFDRQAAKACRDALETRQCDDDWVSYPDACNAVCASGDTG